MPTLNPFCLSNAGSAAYNGTYSQISGASYWQKVGDESRTVYYNDEYGQWYITNGLQDVYYNNAGPAFSIPLTGWVVFGAGVAPAPTVTAGECGGTAPTVTSISPSTGTTAGGTSVTITGTNLTGASAVTIGGTAATGVTVVSSTSITATTPAKTAGTASVLVTTAGGTNSANTLFTYTTPTPTPTPSPTPNTIRIKRSSTTTATPTSLLEGELAANITDKKVWIGNSTKAPVLILDYNNAGNASTATNLANGGAGQVPYNTGSGATTFLAAGTAGQVLQSNATSAPTWTNRVNYTASSTAPSSPAVGDHWYDTDNAALLVYINDGNTSQWVEAGSPSVGAGAIQSNGRLTLESGVPVSPTNQTAKTTVYYTPYNGNILSLYNGTSWNAYTFAELSLALGTLTSGKNYDIFAYVSGSTVTLELSTAWTSDTVRADAISLLNGVYIKTSNNTRRYLGTFRTTATTTTEDSLTKRFVWNINNQQQRPMQKFESTASWTYQNVTYRYVNNNSANRLECVFGLPSSINLVSSLFYSAGTSLQGVRTAIGEDATTSASVNCNIVDGATVPNGYVGTTSYLFMNPTSGYHFYSWLESTFTTFTVTFYSEASGYRRVGISGYVIN